MVRRRYLWPDDTAMHPKAFLHPGLLALFAASLWGQQIPTGFLDRTVTLRGTSYHYQVYVPADYRTRASWPIILFLHGGGQRGSDGLLQTTIGLAAAIRQDPTRFPAIAVFPQAPVDSLWAGTPADMALAALQQAMGEFHGDPERIYLTGLSMGGNGVWYLAYRHPELFAAVVPISGYVEAFPDEHPAFPVVPDATPAPLQALASRLRHTPIWIFHGEMDAVVPVDRARDPWTALHTVAADAQYTEYLGMTHNVWDATYASDTFVRWLFAQRRH